MVEFSIFLLQIDTIVQATLNLYGQAKFSLIIYVYIRISAQLPPA